MENIDEKLQIDIDAMCRMCHHRFGEKSVEIFDDESATSMPISVQIKLFSGIEVSVNQFRQKYGKVTDCEWKFLGKKN